MLGMLGKNFSKRYFEIFLIFFYFSQKISFDISCKLSPKEAIQLKCQVLFSWKTCKNRMMPATILFSASSVEFNSQCQLSLFISADNNLRVFFLKVPETGSDK